MLGDEKGRIYFYDNLRFLLIAFVVIRHFLFRIHVDYDVVSGLYILILSFLMPLFIFITGFYAKGIFTKAGGFRIGRIALFIILYLFLSFSIFLTDFIIKGNAVWRPLTMVHAAWYLWACAVWFALIPILRRTPPIPTLLVSVALSLAVGYVDAIYYTLSLSKIFTFLPFFAAGYYLTRERMTVFLAVKTRWRVLAICLIILLGALAIYYHAEVNFLLKRVVEGKDPYSVAYAGGRGIVALGALWRLLWYGGVVVVSACAMWVIPRCKTVFTLLGTRTLQIYIWHSILVRIFVPTGFFRWLDSFPVGLGQLLMVLFALALTFLLGVKFLGLPFNLLERLLKNVEIGGKRPPA
jgi:fucose 4-O-acetylase-like acetyltransferase